VHDSRFVNALPSSLPRLPFSLAIAVAVILIAVLTGPFGTFVLPAQVRLLLWGVLIGWNMLKWYGWRRFVLTRFDDNVAGAVAWVALGSVLLNASIGMEISLVYRALGFNVPLPYLWIWLTAATISFIIGCLIIAAPRYLPAATPVIPEATPQLPAFVRRGGAINVRDLYAVEAEDHYIRLHLANGRKPMILYRFGDAITELASMPGLQVHRGVWIAEHAVTGAKRAGRNWRLRLPDGSLVPVSSKFLPAVRARQWLTA